MKENTSFVDEGAGLTRMVTKSDGTKVPFSEAHFRESLQAHVEGLNQEYVNTDIIVSKVNSGLYNGKWQLHSALQLVWLCVAFLKLSRL